MRNLLFAFMLLFFSGTAFADHGLPSAADEVHEVGVYTALLGLVSYAAREYFKNRREDKDKRKLEEKIEKSWSHPDDTLTGSKNPGRSQAQLLQLVHDDLQAFKMEINGRLDTMKDDIGKLKGKAGIN